MVRSDEAEAFFHAVYTATQEIPYGKVTTYGHIAMLVGTRTYQRDRLIHLSLLTLYGIKPSGLVRLVSA